MIEKMKKLTFLVTQKEYDGFIAGLREQGVVHVQQLKQGQTSPQLQQALDLRLRYQQAIDYLDISLKAWDKEQGARSKEQENSNLGTTGEQSSCPLPLAPCPLESVEKLKAEEVSIRHEIDEAEKNAEKLEPWGNFDWQSIQRLQEESGMQVFFYACNAKSFQQEWAEKYFATPIDEYRKRTYFLAFSDEEPDIKAERLELPAGSLDAYRKEAAEAKEALQKNHDTICWLARNYRDELEKGKALAQGEIQLQQVELSDESIADGAVRLMVGWTLADKADELCKWLDEKQVFYELEDPAFEDDVPVKITNDGYTSLFEPILRMYSLPNYRDIDPSVFFAPFFMLFFGLCLGDGGYGLLVLLGGIYLALKGSDDVKSYGRLGIWLGLATMVCGLLMGTVFGIDLTKQDWAFLAPVKPYFINDNGIGPIFGYSPMMVFSVIIGLIQVLLGMVLKACKAWKNYGFAYSIGTFSWVVALLSAIALFGLPACGVALPQALIYVLYGLIGVSVVGIFLYNNPSAYKNPITGPLLNIGGGVWATYGMSTGLLGDLLSYIRLFALGLTGGVLGGVFNSLALDLTSSMPWFVRWLPMVLILLAGHGITFALSMISAFVHPMRLTFVEFFKNADFSGGGKEYTPFKVVKG
ncbi:MAG: V-type ATP synthase subunit I [Bacteroidaceae bacterium]|nr:V-type ATP synthase subunit I [Bacteroidaceae bacterium]